MKENTALNATILEEFSDVSDEEVTALLQKTIYEYQRMQRINRIILEVIYELGYVKRIPLNYELEKKYMKLTRLAKLRQLTPVKNTNKIVITVEDVVKEIYNMQAKELKRIEKYSYLYDGYYDGLEDDYTDNDSKENSLDKVAEVKMFYTEVITGLKTKKKVYAK